jgi:nicotinamidase-related amidase
MDALLVIDVQRGMFAIPGFQPHDGEAVVSRIRALIHMARRSAVPVFFIQHVGGPGHPLAAGSPGFPFHSELTPNVGESVTLKYKCSAFQETDLDASLRLAGVDHVVICGMQTEYCVDTAVRAAFERGYRVTLVADGHTTGDTATLRAEDIIQHHNRTLASAFAAVKTAASIEFEHDRAMTHPGA